MDIDFAGLFKEKDKRNHMWAGFAIMMIVFALLTRFDWAVWLFIPALVAPLVWELVTHPEQKGNPGKEERRDIMATWIGSIFGVVIGYLVFGQFW